MTWSFAQLAILVLLVSATGGSPQVNGGYEVFMDRVFGWGEYLGIAAIGWGTGVAGWVAIGHQGLRYLISNCSRAWRLWRKDVLTSLVPAFKYAAGGILFLVAGFFLARWLLDRWISAFEHGVLAGAVVGLIWSCRKVWREGDLTDFLLANRRHVDEDKVPMMKQVD